MTNKTKAAVWTLILLIALSLLAVLITLFTKTFFLLFALGIFCGMVYIIYDVILFNLDK